jgi:hypothetical protein
MYVLYFKNEEAGIGDSFHTNRKSRVVYGPVTCGERAL